MKRLATIILALTIALALPCYAVSEPGTGDIPADGIVYVLDKSVSTTGLITHTRVTYDENQAQISEDYDRCVAVEIKLSGVGELYGIRLCVDFPQEITLVDVLAGTAWPSGNMLLSDVYDADPAIPGTSAYQLHEWCNVSPDGVRSYIIYCDSPSLGNYNPSDGVLATLIFSVPASAGQYELSMFAMGKDIFKITELPRTQLVDVAFSGGALTVTEACSHNWAAATCTLARTCLICGETDGEPLGHTPGDWTEYIAPTNDAHGVERVYCTVCDEVLDERYTPKLSGYMYGDLNSDDKINGTDVLCFRLVLAGDVGTMETVNIDACDIDLNGKNNSSDLLTLRLYLAGDPGVVLPVYTAE